MTDVKESIVETPKVESPKSVDLITTIDSGLSLSLLVVSKKLLEAAGENCMHEVANYSDDLNKLLDSSLKLLHLTTFVDQQNRQRAINEAMQMAKQGEVV